MSCILQARDDQPPPTKRRKQHIDTPSSSDVQRQSGHPGKIRGTILPQEYELERLVAEILNKHSSWTVATLSCKWEGVACNGQGEVTELTFDAELELGFNGEFTGPLHLEYLPRTVLRVSASANCFSGSDISSNLPPDLKQLDLGYNEFSGTINFSHFPSTLSVIILDSNHFEGGVDLGSLPADLNILKISGNSFSGEINLCDLPKRLIDLDISSNEFTGCTVLHSPRIPHMIYSTDDQSELGLDLRSLPGHMEVFDASCNKFSGKLLLNNLPSTLERLLVQENSLTGTLDLKYLYVADGLEDVNFSDNRFNGPLTLNTLPEGLESFRATNNTFTGGLSLDHLPAGLYDLDVSENAFTGA